jgi:hypothetical protein
LGQDIGEETVRDDHTGLRRELKAAKWFCHWNRVSSLPG